jgi:uncharacterized protein (TIGR02646 family)
LRHIPVAKLRLDADWVRRAGEARDAVAAIGARLAEAPEEDRQAILNELRDAISRRSNLWAEIKPELALLSTGKCWYCEAKENRSDMAIDHFRPKNGVKECTTHPGYWWLAFDGSNYRYVCTLCNSPHRNEESDVAFGKGTHFPIVEEARRIFGPAGNLADEAPCLLDPTLAGDPSLLSFLDDGSAAPTYSEARSALFYRKALVSIDVYNLNDAKIKEERFLIAQEIKRQVDRCDKYLDHAATGEQAALDHFQEVYRVILGLISQDAQFSAAARTILAGFRDKDWVVRALSTA